MYVRTRTEHQRRQPRAQTSARWLGHVLRMDINAPLHDAIRKRSQPGHMVLRMHGKSVNIKSVILTFSSKVQYKHITKNCNRQNINERLSINNFFTQSKQISHYI